MTGKLTITFDARLTIELDDPDAVNLWWEHPERFSEQIAVGLADTLERQLPETRRSEIVNWQVEPTADYARIGGKA